LRGLVIGEKRTCPINYGTSANDPKQTSRILFGVSWLARGLISGFRFFAKVLHVSFGLVRCLIVVFADLGDGLVLSRRLYVDDDALPVGCANDPDWADLMRSP
jgi:hypothetical protein